MNSHWLLSDITWHAMAATTKYDVAAICMVTAGPSQSDRREHTKVIPNSPRREADRAVAQFKKHSRIPYNPRS